MVDDNADRFERPYSYGLSAGCSFMGLVAVWLLTVSSAAADLGVGAAVIKLPPIPNGAETVAVHSECLQATAEHVYCLSGNKVFALAMDALDAGWESMGLAGVVDSSRNSEGEISVRRQEGGEAVFYRLAGKQAHELVRHASFSEGEWYADSIGRVWLQERDRDQTLAAMKLTILQGEKEPRVFRGAASNYGSYAGRIPCEYRPGHVALFLNTELIWATPTEIMVRPPPQFASDGTGKAFVRLGKHFLLSGGSNNVGAGAYVVDLREPDVEARRIPLGWDWLEPVVGAPDGRALVQAQTDRNPQFTLFWFAPDGKSQTRLSGADDVRRAGFAMRSLRPKGGMAPLLCFDPRGVGYAAVKDGWLAVFENDSARLVTPRLGLPLQNVTSVAIAGNHLAMLGEAGNVVLWDTRQPLPKPGDNDFERKTQWATSGPCCIDAKGDLWGFLAEFPGKVSRFDGESWNHREIELGNRRPSLMTADDLGNLQLSFSSAPDGTDLITPFSVESWHERTKGWDRDFTKAWKKSLERGAKRFFTGAAKRPRHWTNGRRLWLYSGRALWDGVIEADYHDQPSYERWWVESDGTWRRQIKPTQAMSLMRYQDGRWEEAPDPPALHMLGPDGLRDYDWGEMKSNPGRYLMVTWNPKGEPFAHAPGTYLPRDPMSGHVRSAIPLKGDEVYLSANSPGDPNPGGWVGKWRYKAGWFIDLEFEGEVYEGQSGRFAHDYRKKILKRLTRRHLKVTTTVESTDSGWAVTPLVEGSAPGESPQFIVSFDSAVRGELLEGPVLTFNRASLTGADAKVWAVDQAGNVSAMPSTIRLEREQGAGQNDERPRPQWTAFESPIETSSGHHTITGRGLAIRGDGMVFVTSTSERSPAIELLSYDSNSGEWRPVPTDTSRANGRIRGANNARVGVYELTRAPDGHVYAIGSAMPSEGRDRLTTRGLYLVGINGLQLVTHFNVNRHRPAAPTWDGDGGLWNLEPRSAGRFHRGRWFRKELPLGVATAVASPNGRLAILASGRFWIFENGKLSNLQKMPDGWLPMPRGLWLGDKCLLLQAGRADKQHGVLPWFLVNLEKKTAKAQLIQGLRTLRSDGRGNLWIEAYGQPMQQWSGETQAKRTIPVETNPRSWQQSVPAGTDLLVTKEGVLVFWSQRDGVFTWSSSAGPANHDWRSNILTGTPEAMAEDKQGRVWIRSSKQLLRYDPTGDSALNPRSFEGWRKIESGRSACPGFGETIWIVSKDAKSVLRLGGDKELTWELSAANLKGSVRIEAVSETGDAIVTGSVKNAAILRKNGELELFPDAFAAVEKLTQAGAKRFLGQPQAPVIGPGGIIYYNEKLLIDGAWKPTHKGRAFLDVSGDLMLATNAHRGTPYFYRWQDGQWKDLGEPDQYLIDRIGVRWLEPELLEEEPGRYLVATREGRDNVRVASSLKGPVSKPLRRPLWALPCGRQSFLIAVDGSLMHYLFGPSGLQHGIQPALPMGASSGRVHRFSGGRWAWVLRDQVFISPPNLELAPPPPIVNPPAAIDIAPAHPPVQRRPGPRAPAVTLPSGPVEIIIPAPPKEEQPQ